MFLLRSIVFILLLLPSIAIGQNLLDTPIGISKKELSLEEFFNDLETKLPVKFFFRKSWIEHIKIDSIGSNMTLRSILQKVLHGTEIDFKLIQNYYLILIKDPTHQIEKDRILAEATDKGKIIKRIVVGAWTSRKLTTVFKGKIIDFKNQTPLEGVTITVDDRLLSATSDRLGNYASNNSCGKSCNFVFIV